MSFNNPKSPEIVPSFEKTFNDSNGKGNKNVRTNEKGYSFLFIILQKIQ